MLRLVIKQEAKLLNPHSLLTRLFTKSSIDLKVKDDQSPTESTTSDSSVSEGDTNTDSPSVSHFPTSSLVT